MSLRRVVKRLLPRPVLGALRRLRRRTGSLLAQPVVDAAALGAVEIASAALLSEATTLRAADHRLLQHAEELDEVLAQLSARAATTADLAAAEARAASRIDVTVAEVWQRAEAANARTATAVQSLREEIAELSRQNAALLRLLVRPSSAGEGTAAAASAEVAVVGGAAANGAPPHSDSVPALLPVGVSTVLEEMERSRRDQPARDHAQYIDVFRSRDPVLDLGCGRGEFLETCQWLGITAYGIDADPVAVEHCRALGLDARQAGVLEHLAGLADGSVDAILAAHLVEHLPSAALEPLLAHVGRVLRPGGAAVVETHDPATLSTHVQAFWGDPSRVRPVAAPALAFLARAAGLTVTEVRRFGRPSGDVQLPTVDVDGDERLAGLTQGINGTIERLNELLFGPQVYALIAVKPE